ncbi:MAG: ISNCY family transposase [Paracoccaceae bacterium]|nr:ISNCY family transposase [Paracoccaceae bacterium]
MKFESVLDRVRVRELSQLQAAEILGMSERNFRRWRDRHEAEGLEGLFDRRLGKASARRVPADEIDWVLEQYRTRYRGWTVKHFHDHLSKDPRFCWGYTWTKTQLHAAGLVAPAPRRGAHRRKRPRRPMAGMMLHQDGSSHHWLEGRGPLDLIVTLDDATSWIYSAILVEEEGTLSSFSGLLEVVAAKGLFCSLYTDRGSHYFHTAEAGGKVDKTRLTQVGRALQQLGIEHIPAYSPEARGRSERAFATLQDRLVKELKLAGIATPGSSPGQAIEEANRFIAEVYLPDHNARFAQPPEQPDSAFVPATLEQVRDILCRQEERRVGNDNTVRYQGLALQIPPSPIRPHFVKAKVRVHHYPDGTLAVFHGPRRLASYSADGTPIGQDQLAA